MSGQCTREVVVVGGGLVGLTTALLLRAHGVDVLLVERRRTTSAQPKARRVGFRGMEVFRGLGLAGTVRDTARELADHDHWATGRTLAECEQLPLWGGGTPVPAPETVGPEPPCLIAQDVLEPVLARAARDAGADLRFGTEVTGLDPDADGVTVHIGGRTERARYVVAADGAHSPVRERLGIPRDGRGPVGPPSVNVYFRADLSGVVTGREFNICMITHPDAAGGLASVDGRYRWVFGTREPDGPVDWSAVLRRALGVDAPDLEVLSVLRWRSEMLVAQRYSDGPVFLAGDAAHVMPPYAAAGANTGITDAHNLAWKLAAVLRGQAAESLLESYDAERRPAGWFFADQSTRRAQAPSTWDDPTLAHPFVLSAQSVRYPDGALVPGPSPDTDPEPVAEYAPTGRVGVRVPHRWLDDARTVSTLDVVGPGWAVLDSGRTDLLGDGEVALLRPDGIVAWRGDPARAEDVRQAILAGEHAGVPA